MRSPVTPVLLLLVACGTDQALSPSSSAISPPSFSAVTTTENIIIPIDQSVFIPCANGGAGEDVTLRGNIHLLFHLTDTGHSFTMHSQGNPQGVIGTGEITGNRYHATGITLETTTASKGFHQTFVNNFRIIGPARAGSLLVHEVFHVTVNAKGRVVVDRDRLTVTCR